MKRWLYFSLLLLAMLSACEEKTASRVSAISRHRSVHEIQRSGKLLLGTSISPVSFYYYRNSSAGFEYEMMKAVAKYMRLKLEVIPVADDSMLYTMLQRGEIDAAAHADIHLPGNQDPSVAFSTPTYYPQIVLVHYDSAGGHFADSSYYHSVKLAAISAPSSELEHIPLNEIITYYSKYFQIRKDDTASSYELLDAMISTKKGMVVTTDIAAVLSGRSNSKGIVLDPLSRKCELSYLLPAGASTFNDSINTAISAVIKTPLYARLVRKYFDAAIIPVELPIASGKVALVHGHLSAYDEIIKRHAASVNIDWRLLSAIIYKESNFTPNIASDYGAQGLMQLVPETGRNFGATDLFDPEQNVKAGVGYIRYLQKYWEPRVADSTERINFVLASYNAGLGHIIDARNLASKYGDNPNIWLGHVDLFLLKKAEPRYYKDPVCKIGYCRGVETLDFVHSVLAKYQSYCGSVR